MREGHGTSRVGHAKLATTAIYTETSIEALKAVHARTHPAERPKEPGDAQTSAAAPKQAPRL